MGYMRAGIALEPELAENIGKAAERQGGAGRWLHQTFVDGVALIDPWWYAETAIETVADAVASVIEAVNDESFTDVHVPSYFEELWVGTPVRRRNGAMLLGVGVLPSAGG